MKIKLYSTYFKKLFFLDENHHGGFIFHEISLCVVEIICQVYDNPNLKQFMYQSFIPPLQNTHILTSSNLLLLHFCSKFNFSIFKLFKLVLFYKKKSQIN